MSVTNGRAYVGRVRRNTAELSPRFVASALTTMRLQEYAESPKPVNGARRHDHVDNPSTPRSVLAPLSASPEGPKWTPLPAARQKQHSPADLLKQVFGPHFQAWSMWSVRGCPEITRWPTDRAPERRSRHVSAGREADQRSTERHRHPG
jgi:hypothetical protein